MWSWTAVLPDYGCRRPEAFFLLRKNNTTTTGSVQMLTRYTKTGLGFIFLFIFYYITLFPILVIRANLENKYFILAVAVWGILVAISFLPAAAAILKKVWFFHGKGEPVVLDLLHSLLLEANQMEAPVQVTKQRRKFMVSWRHKEQSWCERLEKSGKKRLYELWLTFDNNTKTVTMSDKYRSTNWDLSPIALQTGWFAFSRPFFKVKIGSEWGVENYQDTPPEEYGFSPNEIKSPIMNTILKNGWNVRFSLF
jgi:hypothetical protein